MSPSATWINFDSRDSTSFADVPGFGQARRIADDERDVQIGSQGLDQVGLARAGRSDQEDVALLHDHIPEIGIGDDGIGSITIPGIDDPLEVVGDAQGEPPLGNVLPDHELVRWATRVLGVGIDAKRASLEGRSGGGAGSGTGWGVISARALVAQKPQMRVVESRTPPSKRGMSWLKQKERQTG